MGSRSPKIRDEAYTRKLEETRALSERRIRNLKVRDGRDPELAARLKRSGTTRMEGPLQLQDDMLTADNQNPRSDLTNDMATSLGVLDAHGDATGNNASTVKGNANDASGAAKSALKKVEDNEEKRRQAHND